MLVIYVMVKSYKKVVCIKVGESLFKNKTCFDLELNKVYLVDENWTGKVDLELNKVYLVDENWTDKANGGNYFIVMRDDMTFGHVFSSEYFIPLAEWRDKQINDILN